jgi:beta-galactosidase
VENICGPPVSLRRIQLKDIFYYYRSWWQSQPVLHLFPHWNWPGKEGQEIDVWCYTNLDSVELLLNGVSLGTKTVARNSHLEWKVKFAPGVIEARGSRDGNVVTTTRRETTGPAARLALRPDRTQIVADGEDVSVVTLEILDSRGQPFPTAGNEVRFTVRGPGRLIGVGNGDPSCHEPDKPASPSQATRSAFNGLAMAIVQALKQPGEITIEARATGLESALTTVTVRPVTPRPTI